MRQVRPQDRYINAPVPACTPEIRRKMEITKREKIRKRTMT